MYSIPPEKWDLLLQIGDYYREDIRSQLDHHYLSVPWAQNTMKYMFPPDNVLVIGAEYDEIKSIQKLGYTVTGFGIQENPYEDIKYVQGDMHNLPFPPKNFDAVVSRGTFEHGHAPWLQTLEIRRVLRALGRVYLEVPKWDDPELGVHRTDYHHTMVLHPIHLRRIFIHLGFRPLAEEEEIRFWWEKRPVREMESEERIKNVIRKYEKT